MSCSSRAATTLDQRAARSTVPNGPRAAWKVPPAARLTESAANAARVRDAGRDTPSSCRAVGTPAASQTAGEAAAPPTAVKSTTSDKSRWARNRAPSNATRAASRRSWPRAASLGLRCVRQSWSRSFTSLVCKAASSCFGHAHWVTMPARTFSFSRVPFVVSDAPRRRALAAGALVAAANNVRALHDRTAAQIVACQPTESAKSDAGGTCVDKN